MTSDRPDTFDGPAGEVFVVQYSALAEDELIVPSAHRTFGGAQRAAAAQLDGPGWSEVALAQDVPVSAPTSDPEAALLAWFVSRTVVAGTDADPRHVEYGGGEELLVIKQVTIGD